MGLFNIIKSIFKYDNKNEIKQKIDDYLFCLPNLLATCDVIYKKPDKIIDKTTRRVTREKIQDFADQNRREIIQKSKKYKKRLEEFIETPSFYGSPNILFNFDSCVDCVRVDNIKYQFKEFYDLVKNSYK